MLKKEVTKEKALERLASLCSRSEQCESDLNRKLIAWHLPAIDRNDIIEYLKTNRYIDEKRYAKSFVNDKARFSAWGPVKIRIELKKRKIKSSVIKEALANVDKDVWKEALLRCVRAKSRNLELTGEEGFENSQKLLRYLISRGFSTEISLRVISLIKRKQEERK